MTYPITTYGITSNLNDIINIITALQQDVQELKNSQYWNFDASNNVIVPINTVMIPPTLSMVFSNPPTSATSPTVSIQVANKQYVDSAQRWNQSTYMPLLMSVIQATNNIYVPGPYASFFDLAPRIAAAPVNVNDAVNKQYVDSLVGGNSFWSLDTSDTSYITTSYNVQFGSLILLGNLTAVGTTSLSYPIFQASPLNTTDGVNNTELIQNIILIKSSYKAELNEEKTERGKLFKELEDYKSFVLDNLLDNQFIEHRLQKHNKPKLLRRNLFKTFD
jgi:hypothetical protein